MDETKGDFPADAAVTAELENTMMTPNTLSPSTACISALSGMDLSDRENTPPPAEISPLS